MGLVVLDPPRVPKGQALAVSNPLLRLAGCNVPRENEGSRQSYCVSRWETEARLGLIVSMKETEAR